jgi:DNA-binding transcriptional regulator GbsR (MarR family)
MAGLLKRTPLDSAASSFIEKLTQYTTEFGVPPSTARILGLLLVCEPRQQSAEAIQEQLSLSSGSVSTAMLSLQQLGYAKRVTFPEDRRFYYELDDDCWQTLSQTRYRQMVRGVALTDEGLAIDKDNERLLAMRRFYQQFATFLKTLS